MSDEELAEMKQTVMLTFANGKIGYFTGRAVIREEDINVKVTNIRITKARPLDNGEKWAIVGDVQP